MKKIQTIFLFLFLANGITLFGQDLNPLTPDFSSPAKIPGMKLVWADEFNSNGQPDAKNWKFENGFVRNEELQWYQE